VAYKSDESGRPEIYVRPFRGPVALFQTRIVTGARHQQSVAADGRFLINTIVDEGASPPITVVHNWAGAR
jgi:hypothetical protein